MNTWNPTDHPRGRLGRFKAKARTEPEAVAESTPTRGRDGSIKWRTVDGRMHRTDGPAATWPDGTEVWFFDGKVHRTDGPAATRVDGFQSWTTDSTDHPTRNLVVSEEWWVHGKRHRDDGPAIIGYDGELEWWENGERKPREVEAALTMLWHARTPGEA